jgi:NAD(P)-dependent dehydrogenase (short-subunit alcohol dehydrogenase family)
MNRLQGKRALLTGGTTGIGLQTAKRFLDEGARVAVTGSNPKNLEHARKELGNDVLVIASDASSVAAQEPLAKQFSRLSEISMSCSSMPAL